MSAVPDHRVAIVPPQSGWPDEFRAVARSLHTALGPLALRIDHIGSASVLGLATKVVIDIQVTVAGLDAPLMAQAFLPAA